MQCIQCCVLETKRDWIAQLEHGPVGPFRDMDTALRVSIADALRIRKTGRPVRVAVRACDGHLRAERCLCDRFDCRGG